MKPAQLGKGLYELTHGLSRNEQEGVVAQFATLLKQSGKLHWARRIIKSFTQYSEEQERRGQAEITVAHKLGAKEEEELKQQLIKKLDAKKVIIRVDRSLLGGAKITKGFTIIDASAKGQLERMHN